MFVKLSWRLRLQFKNPYVSGMQGSIDGVYSGSLRGWAHGGDGKRLALIVRKNGAYMGECTANAPRADLATLGIGDGCCGFSLPVPREFAVRLGDIIEAVDSALPSRKMALRMTRRVVARPGWKGPFAKRADSHSGGDTHLGRLANGFHQNGVLIPTRRTAYVSDSDSAVTSATEFDGLAIRYEKQAVENQQLRAAVSNSETEIQLNLLQLRQVQEELERWFLEYLDVKAKLDSSDMPIPVHAHAAGASKAP